MTLVSSTPTSLRALRCPLCEYAGLAPVPRRRDGLMMIRCGRCGVRFAKPSDPARTSAPAASHVSDDRSDADVRSLESLARDRSVSEERLALIERYRLPGRLISFGTTGGTELRVARARGWEASGFAVDTIAGRGAGSPAGVPALEGTPASPQLDDASCDCVLVDCLLPDLPDPGHYLRLARRILRPGAILFLTVPNEGSVMARAHVNLGYFGFEPRSPGERVSGRLFEFTEASLRTILTRFYGFDVALIEGEQRVGGGSRAGAAIDRFRRRVPVLSGTLRVVATRRP